MNENSIWIALCVHVILCLVYYILIKLRIVHTSGTLMPVMVFVPVFGLISLLLIEWILVRRRDGSKLIDIDKLSLGESIYNKIVVDEGEQLNTVVPLEEAILINDAATRRHIMVEILHRDPGQYLELLKVARLNDDIEVTHYATTSIIEIQRDYELAVQKQSVALRNHPNDVETLKKYIDIMGAYIKSGLLEGHLLYKQRLLYMHPLEKMIELCPEDRQSYFMLFDNVIGMEQFDQATELLQTMIKKWPKDENVWSEGIRLFVECNNSTLKSQMLDVMQTMPINWTAKGKETMRFWCGPDLFKKAPLLSVEPEGTL